jgi:RNA 3'-terminal phosphate cyclase
MDAEVTIIDLRRARNRERMARSHAKQKEAKRAEKIAKRAAKRMIREREAAAIIDLRRAIMVLTFSGMGGCN